MLMTIPKKMLLYSNKLMLDTNIMITDNGVIYDATPHKKGFLNLKDAT